MSNETGVSTARSGPTSAWLDAPTCMSVTAQSRERPAVGKTGRPIARRGTAAMRLGGPRTDLEGVRALRQDVTGCDPIIPMSIARLLSARAVRRRADPAARVAADHPGLAGRAPARRSTPGGLDRDARGLTVTRLAARSVRARRRGAGVHALDAHGDRGARRAHAPHRLQIAVLIVGALLPFARRRFLLGGRADGSGRRGSRGVRSGRRIRVGRGLVRGRRRGARVDAGAGMWCRGPATMDGGHADEGQEQATEKVSAHAENLGGRNTSSQRRRAACADATRRPLRCARRRRDRRPRPGMFPDEQRFVHPCEPCVITSARRAACGTASPSR